MFEIKTINQSINQSIKPCHPSSAPEHAVPVEPELSCRWDHGVPDPQEAAVSWSLILGPSAPDHPGRVLSPPSTPTAALQSAPCWRHWGPVQLHLHLGHLSDAFIQSDLQ